MIPAILILLWLIYCIINVIQIFKKAKKYGDNPIAHNFAKKKVLNIVISGVICFVLSAIIYIW